MHGVQRGRVVHRLVMVRMVRTKLLSTPVLTCMHATLIGASASPVPVMGDDFGCLGVRPEAAGQKSMDGEGVGGRGRREVHVVGSLHGVIRGGEAVVKVRQVAVLLEAARGRRRDLGIHY